MGMQRGTRSEKTADYSDSSQTMTLGDRCRWLRRDLSRCKADLVRVIRATRSTTTRTLSTTTATIRATAPVVEVLRTVGVMRLATGLTVAVVRVRSVLLSLTRVRDRAGDVLRRIIDVKLLVNVLGDGLDFSAQLLLNLIQVEAVLPVDQVNSETQVTETAGTTNTVQVGLSVLGEIEVDDDVDGLNIDTTSQQIGADEVAAHAVAEIVEHSVTVLLKHAGVRVEARVAEFSDLLGEQFHTVCGVTEDNRLVNLKFGEKGVETVNLLLFLNKGVELSNTTESELVHQVDLVRVAHVLVLETLNNHRESRTEKHNLAVLGVERHKLFNHRSKLGGQKLISFIHDKCGTFGQISHSLTG